MDLYVQLIKKTLDYSTIKSTMIKWYDTEHSKKAERYIQVFENAKMRKGESVTMFALRLEQLSSKAYPGLDMRSHRILRSAFLKSLPQIVEKQINDYLISFESVSGQKIEWN